MNLRITLLVGLFLVAWTTTQAQWVSINPGAGGQVQDIVPDPNTPGHLFLASDMEGIYESTDYGQSWKIGGDLLHNRVYTVAVAPGSGNVYAGTLYGLEVSTDGGKNFRLVELTRRKSIGAIAVNPTNPNVVLAGMGWDDDDLANFLSFFDLPREGNGVVYRSEDGGQTWKEVIYDTNNSDRNVYTIRFDPTNGNIVYMGSAKGVYKSTNGGNSWSKLPSPSGTGENRGVALSPDGKALYAAYAIGGGKESRMYATATASPNWQTLAGGSGVNVDIADFWYPEVDPRSTGATHKLTVGLQNSRPGLYEATVTWDGNRLANYSWNIIWSGIEGYDTGWDIAPPNPRFAHYTPTNWAPAIWSTSNQTIFEGVRTGNGYSWNNRYSTPNENFQVPAYGRTFPTYSSRGTESTYTYDITVDGNYVIQGQADNGFVESWDGGVSWANIQHKLVPNSPTLSDVQAVDIGEANGTPVVVAQATSGYGGAAADGRLYVKKLTSRSPQDQWMFLAGGPGRAGGLASGILRDVAVAPAKPNRVFMFSTGNGMYMIDDLGRAINEVTAGRGAGVVKISNGVTSNLEAVKKISPHPTNPNIVFFNASRGPNQGVYKGVKTGAGASDWTWTYALPGRGWDSEVVAWEYNGQTYLYYSGVIADENRVTNPDRIGDPNDFYGALSLDEGQTWTVVISRQDALSLRTNEWYEELKNDFRFQNKGGVAGYDNQLIMSYYDHRLQKAYGVFKGTIDGNGSVRWEDWTDDLHFGGLTSTVVKESGGKRYVYAATAGAGAWRRPAEAGGPTPPPTAPAAPTALAASTVSSNQIDLSWTDNSNNESGFSIERKQGDGAYDQIGTVGANTTTYASTGLLAATAYSYRVRALNGSATSDYSNESSATTSEGGGNPDPDPQPCTNATLISNGEFDNGLTDWQLYQSMDGGHEATVVTDAGLSGNNAVKVTVKSAAMGSGENDIQFFANNTGSLEAGKTYEVIFQAKATADRSMSVKVLNNVSPWTNFLVESVALTTNPQTYSFEFTMSETAPNTRIDFFLGGNGKDVWIDGVVVREKCATAAQRVAADPGNFLETNVSLYPNPVALGTTLTVRVDNLPQVDVEVVELSGRILAKEHVTQAASGILRIDMKAVTQPGLYLVRFRSGSQHWSQKLMVE